MVIGIDAREVQKFPTGIGRYFVGLIEGLLEIQPRHPELVSGSQSSKMLKRVQRDGDLSFVLFVNEGNPLIKREYPENWGIRIVRARPKSFLQQFLFPVEVYLGFLGSFRSSKKLLLTNPFGFVALCPVPQALVILDLIHKHFPQEAFFKARLYDVVLGKLAARRAKAIFTCSENSKKDIVGFLGISKEKVVVTPLGVPKELLYKCHSELDSESDRSGGEKILNQVQDDEGVLEKYSIKEPYILYVGNLRPHKNVGRLIEAISIVKSQKSKVKSRELKLVIVGSDVGKRKKDYCLPEFVNILRSVPDEDLAVLYRQAEMLAQPSLYEGFGMSVLEAMVCGCLVVASKTSSIPEVGGDAPVYVDPRDPKDIARGIMEVLGYNKGEREKVVRKGLERAKAFSWGKMAEKTLKALITNLNE